MTIDEKFLLKLYDLAALTGDLFTPIPFMKVLEATRIKEPAGKNVVKLLAQANFIKKIDDKFIVLTQAGIELVRSMK